MARAGAYTLGELVGNVTMLRVACHGCLRAGQYRVDRLIEQHGSDIALPDLLRVISADCCPEQRPPLESPHCQAYYRDWREHEVLFRGSRSRSDP